MGGRLPKAGWGGGKVTTHLRMDPTFYIYNPGVPNSPLLQSLSCGCLDTLCMAISYTAEIGNTPWGSAGSEGATTINNNNTTTNHAVAWLTKEGHDIGKPNGETDRG